MLIFEYPNDSVVPPDDDDDDLDDVIDGGF